MPAPSVPRRTQQMFLPVHGLAPALLKALLLLCIGFGVLWAWPRDALLDFGSFVAAGRAAAAGLNPYASTYPLIFHNSAPQVGIDFDAVNLNPPLSVPLFQIFATTDPFWAFSVWHVLSFVLYVLTIGLLWREFPAQVTPLRLLWVFSLNALWDALRLGQIYTLLALCCVLAWLLLKRQHPLWAGLFIGLLVALKPNFIVWPGLLLLAGYGSVAGSAFVTAGLLSLIPLALYGPVIYSQWLTATAQLTPAMLLVPNNASLISFTARFGAPWLGMILAGLLLLALAFWAWRIRPSILRVSELALVASLLASPVAWENYTLLFLPFLLTRSWNRWLRGAALLMLVPHALVLLRFDASELEFIAFGSIYAIALLLVLIGLVANEPILYRRWGAELNNS